MDDRGETAAVPTSPALTERLAAAVEAAARQPEALLSGAYHDGVAMAAVTPIAMLFVRRASAASAITPPRRSRRPTSRWRSTCSNALVGNLAVIDLIVRGDEWDIAVEDGVIEVIAPEIGELLARRSTRAGCTCCRGRSISRALQRPGRADWEAGRRNRRVGGFYGASAASRCRSTPTRPPSTVPPLRQARRGHRPRGRGLCAVGRARAWRELDRLDELAARGVVGFKAFACDSGIDDLQAVDDDGLGAGMQRAAVLGLPVAVHAERPSRLRAPRDGSWQ